MERKVTFREYDLPTKDPETGEEYLGDYWGSHEETISGENLLEISQKASDRADELSREWKHDVRVWEIPV